MFIFKPMYGEDTQQFYIPHDIKVFMMGVQSKTFFLARGKGVDNESFRMWEGIISLVRISRVVKGPLKMHYLVYYGKVGTLELDLNAYSWKDGKHFFSFTTTLSRKMLKHPNLRLMLWKRGVQGYSPLPSNESGPIFGTKRGVKKR
jgi:hypothetical protein